ncbi:MAG: hypothetical protein WCL61_04235 [bacterium]
MKKYIYPILFALVGAIIFGVSGFLKLLGIGANDCDMLGKRCDCFCCNSLGLRGYEACGSYGFLVGASVGVIIGLIVYVVVKKMRNKKFIFKIII